MTHLEPVQAFQLFEKPGLISLPLELKLFSTPRGVEINSPDPARRVRQLLLRSNPGSF